jgi:copper homeostasis protein
MPIEIAVFNEESARIAQASGADRIELCDNFEYGGITPSQHLFKKLRPEIHIPIFMMIRPRHGNFEYNPQEFEQMKLDIHSFKGLKADGFVFGILDSDTIDKQRNKELVEIASPLPCTFHRAFDEVKDPFEATETIIDCGFSRILTSGQKPSALEGIDLIVELNGRFKNRIQILPGGGVRSENIYFLKEKTGLKEFHSSAILGKKIIPDANEIKKLKRSIGE